MRGKTFLNIINSHKVHSTVRISNRNDINTVIGVTMRLNSSEDG